MFTSMTIVNTHGLPQAHNFPSKYYNQNGMLKIEQLLQGNPDVRQIQAIVREYIDVLQPSSLDKYFELPIQQSPLLQKIVRYENLLLILTELSNLLSFLGPECTQKNCPVMIATSEWKFLCTVHGTEPTECCAIAYQSHFLDSSLPVFLKSCSQDFLQTTNRQLVMQAQKDYQFIERRSYRILAHAFHHHRALFLQFERERWLFRRFYKYINLYTPKQAQSMVPIIPLEEIK